MSACGRNSTVRSEGTDRSHCSDRRRPFPYPSWVDSCILRFEACSAFTPVTTCRLNESPFGPSKPEAPAALLPPPPLRRLPDGGSSSRAGLFPAVDQRLFTAHCNSAVTPTHESARVACSRLSFPNCNVGFGQITDCSCSSWGPARWPGRGGPCDRNGSQGSYCHSYQL